MPPKTLKQRMANSFRGILQRKDPRPYTNIDYWFGYVDALKKENEELKQENECLREEKELLCEMMEEPTVDMPEDYFSSCLQESDDGNEYHDLDESCFSKDLEKMLERIKISSPGVSFDEIGGQAAAKKELKAVELAISRPGLYEKWGTKPPKGILFYGKPGNGKTLLAKALATNLDALFYNVRLTDFNSKWANESEEILQYIIDDANATAEKGIKTIMFFDEFDGIGPERGMLYYEPWQARIVSILAYNMDGMDNDNIIYIANTNCIESIDKALLRAGRFDKLVEVNNPGYESRKEIIKIYMKKAKNMAKRNIYHDIDIELIANETLGFSGSDITEVIRRVGVEKAILESYNRKVSLITTEDLLEQIRRYERYKSESNIRITT